VANTRWRLLQRLPVDEGIASTNGVVVMASRDE
jgi:hypothetical protein